MVVLDRECRSRRWKDWPKMDHGVLLFNFAPLSPQMYTQWRGSS